MIIKSQNFRLKLEEILEDDLPTERYNHSEKHAIALVRRWYDNASHFTHYTSGSTGTPQAIQISRDKITSSSKATISFIDPENQIKSSLLCLDPTHIGGAMVIYRGIIYNHTITIVPPDAQPLAQLPPDLTFDLVSMVPMQFQSLSTEEVNRFGSILIGGAPMPVINKAYQASVYATFGMTETVSHIALRPLQDEIFQTTGDNKIGIKEDQSLKIKGEITNHKWLYTNDLIQFISTNKFKWLGRKDFIINSGGVKLNPESIEAVISQQMASDFMIGSLPDDKLGRKLVLIVSGDKQKVDFSTLSKYSRPKAVFFNQKIFKTPGAKIDRKKTQEYFEQKSMKSGNFKKHLH